MLACPCPLGAYFASTAWAILRGRALGSTSAWLSVFIKGVYAFGLWLVVLGIISVLLRVIVFLSGTKPAEEVNLQIGHVVTDV